MTSYRCFRLGQAGKAESLEDFDAKTDWEAIELARLTLERQPQRSAFELWRDTRRIFTEPKKPPRD